MQYFNWLRPRAQEVANRRVLILRQESTESESQVFARIKSANCLIEAKQGGSRLQFCFGSDSPDSILCPQLNRDPSGYPTYMLKSDEVRHTVSPGMLHPHPTAERYDRDTCVGW
jgi:hypothetical protein